MVNEFARDYFQNILYNHADGKAIGMTYFRQRGIRDDIVKKFQLGYSTTAHDALAQEALRKGYKKEFPEGKERTRWEVMVLTVYFARVLP